MYKFTVLTLITNNYEPVREIPNMSPDVEYLLVTDNKDTKSDTWTIVYEPAIDNDWMTPQEKIFYIKWNKLFDYCHSDYVLRIDGAISLDKPLDYVLQQFIDGNYDIGIMLHSLRDNCILEYNEWEAHRNNDVRFKNNFIKYCNENYYDLNTPGLVQTTCMFYRKSDITKRLVSDVYNTMKQYDSLKDKNDQCWFTAVLYKYFDNLKCQYLSEQAMHSDYMMWRVHGGPGICVLRDFYIDKEPAKFNIFNNIVSVNYLYEPTNVYFLLKWQMCNQLFVIAAAYHYAKQNRHKRIKFLYYKGSYKIVEKLKKILKVDFEFIEYDEKPIIDIIWDYNQMQIYKEIPVREDDIIINYGCQNKKYFDDTDIDELLDIEYIRELVYKQFPDINSYVSINIRRGDYLDDNNKSIMNSPSDGYLLYDAPSMFEYNQTYLVTSDDVEYCKQLYAGRDNFIFVESYPNDIPADIYDLVVASCCRDNIISNGTFSWWGAYLNKNTEKKIYWKSPWLFSPGCNDIVPSEWIDVNKAKRFKRKYTIIMTCTNPIEYIEKTMEMLLWQTHRNYELIILDNNSTDYFYSKVKYYEQHLTIRYFLNYEGLDVLNYIDNNDIIFIDAKDNLDYHMFLEYEHPEVMSLFQRAIYLIFANPGNLTKAFDYWENYLNKRKPTNFVELFYSPDENDRYVNLPLNAHHYTFKYHYEKVVPKVFSYLGIDLKELDNFHWVSNVNDNGDFSYLVPNFKTHYKVTYRQYFHTEKELFAYEDKTMELSYEDFRHTSDNTELENYMLGSLNIDHNDDYHTIFRFYHNSCIIENTLIDNDKVLLINGTSHDIIYLQLLTCFYKKIIYLDKRGYWDFTDYWVNEPYIDDVIISSHAEFLDDNEIYKRFL